MELQMTNADKQTLKHHEVEMNPKQESSLNPRIGRGIHTKRSKQKLTLNQACHYSHRRYNGGTNLKCTNIELNEPTNQSKVSFFSQARPLSKGPESCCISALVIHV